MKYLNNPVQIMADVTAQVTYNNIFPKIKYYSRNFEATKNFNVTQFKELGNMTFENHPEFFIEKEKNPTTYDFRVIGFFPQMWGSTALGLGGVGGAAMTEAYTTVVNLKNHYAVFFDNHFAYMITDPSLVFFEDIKNHMMKSVRESVVYKNLEN